MAYAAATAIVVAVLVILLNIAGCSRTDSTGKSGTPARREVKKRLIGIRAIDPWTGRPVSAMCYFPGPVGPRAGGVEDVTNHYVCPECGSVAIHGGKQGRELLKDLTRFRLVVMMTLEKKQGHFGSTYRGRRVPVL